MSTTKQNSHSEAKPKNLALAWKMFVYIITNHINSVLYIGVTNNLQRRILEHKNKLFENSFSKKYKLYKLVWCQEFNNPQEAIEAEKKIKGWKRDKKIALIKEANPEFKNIEIN